MLGEKAQKGIYQTPDISFISYPFKVLDGLWWLQGSTQVYLH